jgi:threonine synthase
MLETLRKGMYGAVVSGERMMGLIPSVHRTGGYILDPYAALAFGGLQDYRAKTGTHRTALLICDRSPLCDKKLVCAATGFSEKELKSKLER